MSGRIFQNVVLQIKEATDRVLGVIDAEGVVISCSDLGLIGTKWPEYVETINRHIGSNIFTDVIANNCEYRPEQKKYLSDNNRRPVMCDGKNLKALGLNVHCTDLIHETDLFRHDAEKLHKLLAEELSINTL